MSIRWISLLFAAFITALVFSMEPPKSYSCEVKHVYSLTDQGSLGASQWQEQMKGSEFTVSVISGEIVGDVLTTALASSTTVINEGSKDNSFKTVADFADQYQVVEIQVFREGKVKPFVALSMGGAGVVTGVCQ